MPRFKPLLERFWPRVHKNPGAGCWEWTGAFGSHGYGVIGVVGNKTQTTHRVAWETANGPIPPGLFVLHRCDNRRCVRVDHLYLGDAKQNSEDVRNRGSTAHWNIADHRTLESAARRVANLPRGAYHHRSTAKLSAAQAAEVFAAGGSQRAIARRFGICQQTVSNIKQRKRWSHVNANPE